MRNFCRSEIRKTFCLLVFCVLMAPNVLSQVLKPDSTGTYYSEMWNVYNSFRRLTYISFLPYMKVNGTSGYPLLFEASISPYFTFYRGRDYGKFGYARPQLKSLMIYFNPEFVLRMYQQEPIGVSTKSLPVLPVNFVPRISFVKFIHRSNVGIEAKNFKRFHFIEFSVAHYSNGQENRHFLQDTVRTNGDSIPNYMSGNFSTNYLRLGYTYGFLDKNFSVYSINPYVQNDGGIGSVFSYDPAQEKSYGKWRAGLTLQFQSGMCRIYRNRSKKVGLVTDSTTNAKTDTYKPIKKPRDYYITVMVRWNSETIVDNLDAYPSDQKLRYATRLTVQAHPLNWRNFAFMAELYYGRDFYNIRFYDKLFQFKFGLVADNIFYTPRNTYD